jgi:hypothetical protein
VGRRQHVLGHLRCNTHAGELILLISWKDAAAAQAYEDASEPNDKARVRRVRIVRDYGKYDRREAPQYYADAKGGETLHA